MSRPTGQRNQIKSGVHLVFYYDDGTYFTERNSAQVSHAKKKIPIHVLRNGAAAPSSHRRRTPELHCRRCPLAANGSSLAATNGSSRGRRHGGGRGHARADAADTAALFVLRFDDPDDQAAAI